MNNYQYTSIINKMENAYKQIRNTTTMTLSLSKCNLQHIILICDDDNEIYFWKYPIYKLFDAIEENKKCHSFTLLCESYVLYSRYCINRNIFPPCINTLTLILGYSIIKVNVPNNIKHIIVDFTKIPSGITNAIIKRNMVQYIEDVITIPLSCETFEIILLEFYNDKIDKTKIQNILPYGCLLNIVNEKLFSKLENGIMNVNYF